MQQHGFRLPGNTLTAVKRYHRKNDGKIQSGHIRLIGFTVAMAIWGACTNTQSWIFRVWEASVQRVWWLTFWHQLLFCDTAIITSGKNKSFCCFISRKKPCPAPSSAKPEPSLSFCAYGESVAALWKRPERRCQESRDPGAWLRFLWWGGAQGQSIPLKHLRSTKVFSFAEQQIVFFIFRAPVLFSCKAECYSGLEHSWSLLILMQSLTFPAE